MTTISCVCRQPIGEEVTIDGAPFLRIGPLLVRAVHGVCIQCGRKFHWTTSDVLMRKILEGRHEKTTYAGIDTGIDSGLHIDATGNHVYFDRHAGGED